MSSFISSSSSFFSFSLFFFFFSLDVCERCLWSTRWYYAQLSFTLSYSFYDRDPFWRNWRVWNKMMSFIFPCVLASSHQFLVQTLYGFYMLRNDHEHDAWNGYHVYLMTIIGVFLFCFCLVGWFYFLPSKDP